MADYRTSSEDSNGVNWREQFGQGQSSDWNYTGTYENLNIDNDGNGVNPYDDGVNFLKNNSNADYNDLLRYYFNRSDVSADDMPLILNAVRDDVLNTSDTSLRMDGNGNYISPAVPDYSKDPLSIDINKFLKDFNINSTDDLKNMAEETIRNLRNAEGELFNSVTGAFRTELEKYFNDAIGTIDTLANQIQDFLDPTVDGYVNMDKKNGELEKLNTQLQETKKNLDNTLKTLAVLDKAYESAQRNYDSIKSNPPADDANLAEKALYNINLQNAWLALAAAKKAQEICKKSAETLTKKVNEKNTECQNKQAEIATFKKRIIALAYNIVNAKLLTDGNGSGSVNEMINAANANDSAAFKTAFDKMKNDTEQFDLFPTMLPLCGYFEGPELKMYEKGQRITHNDGYPNVFVVDEPYDPRTGVLKIQQLDKDGNPVGDVINVFDAREVFPIDKLMQDDYSIAPVKEWIKQENPAIFSTAPVDKLAIGAPKPASTEPPKPLKQESPTPSSGGGGGSPVVGQNPYTGGTSEYVPEVTPTVKEIVKNTSPVETTPHVIEAAPTIDTAIPASPEFEVAEAMDNIGPGELSPDQLGDFEGSIYGESPAPASNTPAQISDAAPHTGLDGIYATNEQDSKNSVGFGALAGLAIGAAGLGLSGLAAAKNKDDDDKDRGIQNANNAVNGLYGMYGMSKNNSNEDKSKKLVFNNDGSYSVNDKPNLIDNNINNFQGNANSFSNTISNDIAVNNSFNNNQNIL